MKRYIHSGTDISEADRYESIVADQLISYGVIDAVDQYKVLLNSSSTYKIVIVLTAKNYHRKKFTVTAYPSKMNDAVDKICYQVDAWVKEGSYILAEDACAIKVYLDGVLLGYYNGGASQGPVEHWYYIDPSKAARVGNPNEFKLSNYTNTKYFIDEEQLGYACLKFVKNTPQFRTWLSTYTYHKYAYAEASVAQFSYEAIPYLDVKPLKLNASAFDSVLIEPADEEEFSTITDIYRQIAADLKSFVNSDEFMESADQMRQGWGLEYDVKNAFEKSFSGDNYSMIDDRLFDYTVRNLCHDMLSIDDIDAVIDKNLDRLVKGEYK